MEGMFFWIGAIWLSLSKVMNAFDNTAIRRPVNLIREAHDDYRSTILSPKIEVKICWKCPIHSNLAAPSTFSNLSSP